MLSFSLNIIIASAVLLACNGQKCSSRQYNDGYICVCNSTYCDSLEDAGNVTKGTYVHFVTSKSGTFFEKHTGQFENDMSPQPLTITVNPARKYQQIMGFGGAFTDSSGINIAQLPSEAQQKLMDSYFSKSGANYNLGRVPIAGTDCSTRGYSYADSPSGSIDNFTLQEEDYKYKIPYINRAMNLTGNELILFASVWSSPPWMKYNNNYSGDFLIPKYYQMWADYIVRFFEEYEKNQVTFWGFALQNEPLTGLLRASVNSIAWLVPLMIDWICNNIGPTLKNSKYSDLKIILHDENTVCADAIPEIFANDTALSYIDGTAFHWYTDESFPPSLMKLAKTPKKETFLFYSEASYLGGVQLGSYSKGETYASDIVDVLNNDGAGWTDWNLALDVNGGPNYVDNYLDAAIIVNSTAGEFYKQPMYYAIAHFSKFLTRDAVRIESETGYWAAVNRMKTTSFMRPDGKTAIIIVNRDSRGREIRIRDLSKEGVLNVYIEESSINTIIY